MTTILHNWYNKHTHMFRSDGRVVRVNIQELVSDQNHFCLKVLFLANKKNKKKYMSPISIASLQVLWNNIDVVSDEELPDNIDTVTDFIPPRECDHLPLWVVTNSANHPVLESLVRETNHFITLSSPVTKHLRQSSSCK